MVSNRHRKILHLTAKLCDSFENRPKLFSYKTLNLRVEIATVIKPSQTCFVLKIYILILKKYLFILLPY
jgi:hypothetical protein